MNKKDKNVRNYDKVPPQGTSESVSIVQMIIICITFKTNLKTVINTVDKFVKT